MGGDRSENVVALIGGDGELDPMQTVFTLLVTCRLAVVVRLQAKSRTLSGPRRVASDCCQSRMSRRTGGGVVSVVDMRAP